jgi:hypothetical protein
MFKDSVLSKTGQLWKVWLGILALVLGSTVPLVEASGMSWTTGTIIAVVGYGFTLAFVLCPSCGLRWFWKALLYSEMYVPLFKQPTCPGCKHDFSIQTGSQ